MFIPKNAVVIEKSDEATFKVGMHKNGMLSFNISVPGKSGDIEFFKEPFFNLDADNVDTFLAVVSAMRNAKMLGLVCDKLWLYKDYICVRNKTYTECLTVLWYMNLVHQYPESSLSLSGQYYIDLYGKRARIGEQIKLSWDEVSEVKEFPATTTEEDK